jgi:glycine/D-amino acid oxidase-like deaminating enzyme
MPNSLPSESKVVIIGGGVVGSSVAYHLTKFGWKDVLLVEQNKSEKRSYVERTHQVRAMAAAA